MYSYRTEYLCRVDADAIWQIVGDVRHWPEFDSTLRRISDDGPAGVGSRPRFEISTLKPRRGRVVAREEMPEGREITVNIPIFRVLPGLYLSRLTTSHKVLSLRRESRILSEITVGGPFPNAVRQYLVRDFEAGLPVRVEQLIVVAHTRQTGRQRKPGARSNAELSAAGCRRVMSGRIIPLGE